MFPGGMIWSTSGLEFGASRGGGSWFGRHADGGWGSRHGHRLQRHRTGVRLTGLARQWPGRVGLLRRLLLRHRTCSTAGRPSPTGPNAVTWHAAIRKSMSTPTPSTSVTATCGRRRRDRRHRPSPSPWSPRTTAARPPRWSHADLRLPAPFTVEHIPILDVARRPGRRHPTHPRPAGMAPRAPQPRPEHPQTGATDQPVRKALQPTVQSRGWRQPPAEHIEALRLNRHADSSKHPPPIEQVASACSFGTVETMNRAFRRKLNTTPMQHRHHFSTRRSRIFPIHQIAAQA